MPITFPERSRFRHDRGSAGQRDRVPPRADRARGPALRAARPQPRGRGFPLACTRSMSRPLALPVVQSPPVLPGLSCSRSPTPTLSATGLSDISQARALCHGAAATPDPLDITAKPAGAPRDQLRPRLPGHQTPTRTPLCRHRSSRSRRRKQVERSHTVDAA